MAVNHVSMFLIFLSFAFFALVSSGCGFFAYSWKLPAYNGAFLLTIELSYLQLTILAFLLTISTFLLTILAFLLTIGALFAYNGKVRLIRALRDCKQRSSSVSKKAPTVSWWTFRPRKKNFTPPPPNSPIRPDTLPAPQPLSLLKTLGFSIKKIDPPPPFASDSSFRLHKQKK